MTNLYDNEIIKSVGFLNLKLLIKLESSRANIQTHYRVKKMRNEVSIFSDEVVLALAYSP